MQKPTFSLDCGDAAEHLDPAVNWPTEFLAVESFHLIGVIADTLVVCVHSTNGDVHQIPLPEAVRECLPEEDELSDHFERLLRAPLN